jgi:hypothetical protein
MCHDPEPGATASLVVESTPDADVDLDAVLADLGGEVVREGRFVTVVELSEARVASLCAVAGLARVETTDTLGLALEDGDTGTDPDPDPETGEGAATDGDAPVD